MKEVKIYHLSPTGGLAEGEKLGCISVYLKSDYESLRKELENEKARIPQYIAERAQTEQRLLATEQRNADTIAKLEIAASMMDDDERGNRFEEVCRLAIKSLKPTESGAIEVAKQALRMENQRITPVRVKCLACGDYHEVPVICRAQ